MDRVVYSIVSRLGRLKLALFIDGYAQGKDTRIIDLVFVGNIDHDNLYDLISKTERYVSRKIRSLVVTEGKFKNMKSIFEKRPKLVLWEAT